MRIPALILALSANALLIACADREVPAQKLLATADQVMNDNRADAAKYAPELLQESEAALAQAKQDFAEEDYEAVLAAQPLLNEKLTAMRDTVVSTQTAMAAATREWEELSEEVPKLVAAIEVQVDNLKGQKQQEAKAELETMKATWQEATAAYSAGKPLEAADKARFVQVKAKEVSEQLGA